MEALAAAPSYLHLPTPAPAARAGAVDGNVDPQAWAAAQDFESQFVSTLFQSMFEGVNEDNPFGGGPGETMFRSLLVDQYSQQMVKTGGIGIAGSVYREMLRMQEVPQ